MAVGREQHVATVNHWTGLEARALRLALRMSVRAFAEHLGVGVRTVSKWEKLLSATEPRPDTQAILDTALSRADAAVHLRFATNLSDAGRPASVLSQRVTVPGPRSWEYESWTDDMDRAAIALSRQDFAFADRLLHRWLDRFTLPELDDQGAYLFARSMALLGDIQRDKGTLLGPLSAQRCYRQAHDLYSRLDLPRRVGQMELLLVLVDEMAGRLDASSREYERLATDRRLSGRDRARSRLWLGRALSKLGDNDSAIKVMSVTAQDFEDLGEPADWSVTQQKVALAHRGTGDLARALRHLYIARASGSNDSPLQRVRLNTAYGHIHMSDPATREMGLAELQGAAETAGRYGLGHQLRSIESIRRSYGIPSAVPLGQAGSEGESGSASAGARAAWDHR